MLHWSTAFYSRLLTEKQNLLHFFQDTKNSPYSQNIICELGGGLSVTIIVLGNGIDESSSNPVQECLRLTSC